MASCLLFAYGLLQPGFQPPRTMRRHWPDAVRGKLYDLGPHPAAIDIGLKDEWFAGVVIELDDSELPELDAFEETEEGVYARIQTETRGGRVAWIYEYRQPVPEGAPKLARWPETPPPAP